MKYKTGVILAALVLAGCSGQGDEVTEDKQSGKYEAAEGVMTWDDLLSRPQPKPDATLSYGDDPLQVVDVWRPDAVSSPAVVMVHGGCWQTGIAERDIMNWIADDLRAHGVGVWNIEYRGVDRGGGYPGTYNDVAAAADMFAEKGFEYGLQTSRRVVIGHSAGGHLALWLANRSRLKIIDDIRGNDPVEFDLVMSQGGLPDLAAGALREGHPCGTDAPKAMSGPLVEGALKLTSPPEMEPGEAVQVMFNNTLDHIAPPKYAREYKARMAAKAVPVDIVETAKEGHVELIAPDSKSWAKQRAMILKNFGLPQKADAK